jgi:tetratricopeptide (TPR) repeat protein
MARSAAISPEEIVPWPKVVAWAEIAASSSDAGAMPWYSHVAGLAQLRAGDMDKALEWLQTSASSGKNWHPELNQVALGLLYALRGDAAEARGYVQQAQNWLEGAEEKRENGYYKGQVTDWLEFRLIFPETVALLKDQN